MLVAKLITLSYSCCFNASARSLLEMMSDFISFSVKFFFSSVSCFGVRFFLSAVFGFVVAGLFLACFVLLAAAGSAIDGGWIYPLALTSKTIRSGWSILKVLTLYSAGSLKDILIEVPLSSTLKFWINLLLTFTPAAAEFKSQSKTVIVTWSFFLSVLKPFRALISNTMRWFLGSAFDLILLNVAACIRLKYRIVKRIKVFCFIFYIYLFNNYCWVCLDFDV